MLMDTPVTDMQALSDAELIQRILGGEKQCFEPIIRRYNARLYRIGMSITRDDTAVEDVMQNAYIKAYEHLSGFQGRAGFGTWLVRIMINESLLYVRKKHNHDPMENAQPNDDRDNRYIPQDRQAPDAVVINKELAGALEQSLLQLPEKYRLVFVMREMEQMSVAETTAALDLTESNVKVRLNRAKAMLRDKLTSFYRSDAVFPFHLTRCDRIVQHVFSFIREA